MDINKLFGECLEEMQSEGKVKELMKNQLETTIKRTFSDLFGEYGAFKDKLQKAVGQEVNLDISKVDLLQWSGILNGIISSELTNLLPQAINPLKATIKDAIGVLDKQEWKLSEIVLEYAKAQMGDENTHLEIDFRVETSNWGSVYVYLGNGKDNSDKDQWTLFLGDDNKMYSYLHRTYAGKVTPANQISDTMRGFELFAFKLYAAGVTVIIDERNVQTEYYTD